MTDRQYRVSDFVEVSKYAASEWFMVNYADRSWRVENRDGEIWIEDASHPKLIPKNPIRRAWVTGSSNIDVSVLSGRKGWLLGWDYGEWGGGLEEYALRGRLLTKGDINGRRRDALSRRNSTHPVVRISEASSDDDYFRSENVLGLFEIPDGAVVVRGLAHLGVENGRIEVYEGEIGRGLKLVKYITLPTAPYANCLASPGQALIAGTGGLFEVDLHEGRHKKLRIPGQSEESVPQIGVVIAGKSNRVTFGRFQWGLMYPDSLAKADNVIYLGARHAVIKLSQGPQGLIETWLVHPDDDALVAAARHEGVTEKNYDDFVKKFRVEN